MDIVVLGYQAAAASRAAGTQPPLIGPSGRQPIRTLGATPNPSDSQQPKPGFVLQHLLARAAGRERESPRQGRRRTSNSIERGQIMS